MSSFQCTGAIASSVHGRALPATVARSAMFAMLLAKAQGILLVHGSFPLPAECRPFLPTAIPFPPTSLEIC